MNEGTGEEGAMAKGGDVKVSRRTGSARDTTCGC